MAERRVTRNAWARNKSNLALKRRFFDPDYLSDEEIEIDLSEQIEEKYEGKPKKQRVRKESLKNDLVNYLTTDSLALETETDRNETSENLTTIFAESETEDPKGKQAEAQTELVTQTNDEREVDISQMDDSRVDLPGTGHFLATPIGTCDPKSIWATRHGRLPVRKFVNNPAKKRLEELERMVKLNKAKEKRRKLQTGDESSGKERKTNKGAFRSKVDLNKYYRKDFATFDEVVTHIKQLEEEHGVRWNKVGNSADFRLSLEEYVEKYGDKIEQRQRLVYYANTAFPIEYFGNPYMVIEESINLCEFGMSRKYRYETKKKVVDENGELVPQRTKKVCCSAEICVRKILVFRKISIPENSEYQRNLASKKVREILRGWAARGKKVEMLKKSLGAELVYICWTPTEGAHDMVHPMKDQRAKPVHPAIIAYIRQMTENGVTVGSQMMKCVDHFVRQNFPEATLPENLGKRPYWPEIKKIRNVMESWMVKKKITRTPRARSMPRPELPKRPYRRRIPIDPSKIVKRKKKNGLSVTGNVWLDEYGELCYTVEEYQANEVVVTTEDDVEQLVADVVTDDFDEYYEEDGEVVQEEYVITDDLPMEEIEYTEEKFGVEKSALTNHETMEYEETATEEYAVTHDGEFVMDSGEYPEANNDEYCVTDNNEYTVTDNLRSNVLEIVKPTLNPDPCRYERRVTEAQESLRTMILKLTELSYSVEEVTALEFAQRYVTDAIELLEEHVETDLESQSDVESADQGVKNVPQSADEQDVVWVSVDSRSNELRKIEPPGVRTDRKIPLLQRNDNVVTEPSSKQHSEEVYGAYHEELQAEPTRTLKVISLPPPGRRIAFQVKQANGK